MDWQEKQLPEELAGQEERKGMECSGGDQRAAEGLLVAAILSLPQMQLKSLLRWKVVGVEGWIPSIAMICFSNLHLLLNTWKKRSRRNAGIWGYTEHMRTIHMVLVRYKMLHGFQGLLVIQ